MVLIHGGAGSTQPTKAQLTCLSEGLTLGIEQVQCGRSALDAVEAMIRYLEESGLFNAGRGARKQLDGVQRMDAALMEGERLRAGGVACVERLQCPISAARLVMEHTPHVLLAGSHVKRFVRTIRAQLAGRLESPRSSPHTSRSSCPRAIVPSSRMRADSEICETVGAVACDLEGNTAAGASTGGIPFMLPGRVGDSPIIGAGVYADNTAGAVSMTGAGEKILRLGMAKTIALLLKLGKSPGIAARIALRELLIRLKGEAGCLILTPEGRFAIYHTTPWMSAGYWNGRGSPIVRRQWKRVTPRNTLSLSYINGPTPDHHP
ncbi:MAG: hypothetical protein D6690_03670 [Nitrospirae bacterium]|nr:MAG: hypothetical protein D6690_03670 [Nitrospirota bacterium]